MRDEPGRYPACREESSTGALDGRIGGVAAKTFSQGGQGGCTADLMYVAPASPPDHGTGMRTTGGHDAAGSRRRTRPRQQAAGHERAAQPDRCERMAVSYVCRTCMAASIDSVSPVPRGTSGRGRRYSKKYVPDPPPLISTRARRARHSRSRDPCIVRSRRRSIDIAVGTGHHDAAAAAGHAAAAAVTVASCRRRTPPADELAARLHAEPPARRGPRRPSPFLLASGWVRALPFGLRFIGARASSRKFHMTPSTVYYCCRIIRLPMVVQNLY
eukprot:SAG31_NODE_2618_length_5366_cov_2.137650_8_plen_272_part_00